MFLSFAYYLFYTQLLGYMSRKLFCCLAIFTVISQQQYRQIPYWTEEKTFVRQGQSKLRTLNITIQINFFWNLWCCLIHEKLFVAAQVYVQRYFIFIFLRRTNRLDRFSSFCVADEPQWTEINDNSVRSQRIIVTQALFLVMIEMIKHSTSYQTNVSYCINRSKDHIVGMFQVESDIPSHRQ